MFWCLDSELAYQRHFPAINWLSSYSLYLDNIGPWFSKNIAEDWMDIRQRLMSLLQDESSLNEIVKMVGMDALSPQDRLKMEAARSTREDFLHQNSFDEVDTYTSLPKQYYMMKLAFYEEGVRALEGGMDIERLVHMDVRERIGRYKYTPEKDCEPEFEAVRDALSTEIQSIANEQED